MAITVNEKFESLVTIDTKAVTRLYVIQGTDSDTAAMAAVKAEAPTTYNGMIRKDPRIEPAGPELWLGEVPYAAPGAVRPKPLDVGESAFSFSSGGSTVHATQSKNTTCYPVRVDTPTFGGTIGVTEDGKVQGVDIGLRAWRWSETHVLADADVDDAYKRALFELTYTTNDAPFKGHAAGECLFMGADGSKRGDGDWEITFNFAGSPNVTGLTIDTITGIAKKGWEHLWVLHEKKKHATAIYSVLVPKAVYVEKVYEDGDFDGLEVS